MGAIDIDPELLRDHLEAFLAGDAHGIVDVFDDRAQSAVRDYVNETGTLTGLRSRDDHLSYYRAFFDKFELPSSPSRPTTVDSWSGSGTAPIRPDIALRAGIVQRRTGHRVHRGRLHPSVALGWGRQSRCSSPMD